MIEAKNLTKIFGERAVLDGIDCSVEPGRITVIIGPSGGGKSTLLRALALVDPPHSGFIRIDEKEYTFPLENGVRVEPPWPRLTVVFQQLFLWPHLTLRQNILLPTRRRQIPDLGDKLEQITQAFGMELFLDRYPNETSQGQRQRAALARAFLLEPDYLLLDEVTSALDVESIAAVLDHLGLLRARGVGLLLVTHLLGFARRMADSVMFLDGGKTLEAGGKGILENPINPKLRRFIELVESSN